MNKAELRKLVLEKRISLSKEEVIQKSSLIAKKLIDSALFKNSKNIACYFPYKNEVDLLILLTNKEKNILFPKVVKGSRILDFYIVKSLNDFEKGAFGIMEPKASLPRIKISDIALFLVPGTAFSITGERIGYGGGYYDTTLEKRSADSIIAGICFDTQIIAPGFSDPWDKKIHYLLNETNFIKVK